MFVTITGIFILLATLLVNLVLFKLSTKKYIHPIVAFFAAFLVSIIFSYSLLKKYSFFQCLTKKEITSDSINKVILINTLNEEYFEDCHIKGSINIPANKLEESIHTLDKNKTYIVYCANSMCHIGHDAINILKKYGFKNIYEYSGGMAEWYQLSQENPAFQCTGPCQSSYLHIIIPKEIAKQKENLRSNARSSHTNLNINYIEADQLLSMLNTLPD